MTNWVIFSSVLILAIIVLRRICRGKISLRCQYALWFLVAVRLLLPVNFGTSILSIENLTAQIGTQPQIKSEIQASEQWPADVDYAGFYEEVLEQYTNRVEQTAELAMNWNTGGQMEGNAQTYEKVQKVCFYIWIVGAISLSTAFVITNALFDTKLKKNREKIDVSYLPLPVYQSEEVETPCLVGILETKIYVTQVVAEDPTLLKHAVCHELTHYKHRDQLWSWVRCICLALHWYNPLVWWAASLSKKDAEFACDEGTLRALGEEERAEYGKSLIRLTCENGQDMWLATTTMAAGKKNINERIRLIAQKPRTRKYVLVLTLAIVLIFAGATFTEAKAETREEVELGIGKTLENINWEKIGTELGGEEAATLQKYQSVLEGGTVLWVEDPYGREQTTADTECQFAIEEHIKDKMSNSGLEIDEILVESFLFADVFQSGEENVCLLLRHASKSWVILHEEEGIIYGIDMTPYSFKGVQKDGMYYASGCQGMQYYRRMSFSEGSYQEESVGTVVKGQLLIAGDGKTEMEYQQWRQDNMSEEVMIYTLIGEIL